MALRPGGGGINRRRLLGRAAALTAGLAVSASAGIALAAEAPSRLRLMLPAPTGPHQVGTVSLHVVDHTRQDPWWTTAHPRELMVSLWYPARDAGRRPLTPWLPPAALAHYRTVTASQLEQTAQMLGLGEVTISLDNVDYPFTHARAGVPVKRSDRPYPVVLYSPGLGLDREMGTTLVEDLASRGYVVVTIDHTYDAGEVQFPGRRVELGRPNLDQDGHTQVAARFADARFVLDQLAGLAAGHNPDAGHQPLPAGLPGALDLARIGMFGHSLGGATTAQTMAHDDRIIAGIDMDGSVIPDVPFGPPTPREQAAELAGEVANRIGNRPLMIMTSGGSGPDQLGALMTGFWSHLRGWRRFLSLVGSTHGSYTDEMHLIRQLAAAGIIPSALAGTVGTIDPARATAAQRAYIGAFFDLWLRDRNTHLLDGPSTTYPEITFFPSA
jgi:dienelactone hydrolase